MSDPFRRRGRIGYATVVRALALCAALLTAAPAAQASSLVAQEPELVTLELSDDGGVVIGLGSVLESAGVQESLMSGLPVRLQIVTELWRDRFFDAQEGRDEWRATVWFDPLSETYRVETADAPVGRAGSPAAAGDLLRSTLTSTLRPTREGTYYYLSRLDVETFSLTDLEELRRWLRGDLAPAVDADDPVGGAFGRGVRRLFVRALGLPALRYQARSEEFDFEP